VYDAFGSSHDVNYHLRTIAHNTVLVNDPAEKWERIRAGPVSGNDGGQAHVWPHHNGAVSDAAAWRRDRGLYDIGEILAFEDEGSTLYVAGDATRAYSQDKLVLFTRQIVFIRPNTFLIFDRVKSKRPGFKKTWLLQAAKKPTGTPPNLVVTNGKGRLFIQTLLPEDPEVNLASGDALYCYGGKAYLPARDTGPAPECRIEISPAGRRNLDLFLHVLTAADGATDKVPEARCRIQGQEVIVTLEGCEIIFERNRVSRRIEFD
jgi:heparin/heparan-sulfate lyase